MMHRPRGTPPTDRWQRVLTFDERVLPEILRDTSATVPGILTKTVYGLYIAQGGFVAGLVAMNSAIRTIGIEIDADPEAVDGHVRGVAEGTLDLLGVADGLPDGVVEINPDYAGEAYGKPTDAMVEAVTLVARLEGLILDPVYSGKAMAGLIDLVKRGEFKATETVVFVHTGGMPALFAYRSAFADI